MIFSKANKLQFKFNSDGSTDSEDYYPTEEFETIGEEVEPPPPVAGKKELSAREEPIPIVYPIGPLGDEPAAVAEEPEGEKEEKTEEVVQ